MVRALGSLLTLLVLALPASDRDGGTPATAPRVGTSGADASGPTARDLRFFHDLFTFRSPDGGTTVLAAFAVPVRELRRERENSLVRYRFDVTLVLADTALKSVTRRDDSVFVSVPQPLAGGHLLFTHLEVETPPSSSTLQRVIMTDASTPGIGELKGAPFAIPDYSGDDLMLSDLALGEPGAEVGWRRGDVTLALLPTRQFPGRSFDLYYEIYNLADGAPYSTEISIEPVDLSGERARVIGRAIRTRFTGESARSEGAMHAELRRVDTSLDEGEYRLTVTVTDEDTGETTRRSRFLRVRVWDRGTSLVPAYTKETVGVGERRGG